MGKQDTAFCYLQGAHLNDKDRHYLRVKGWKKFLQANGPKKPAAFAILYLITFLFSKKLSSKMGKDTLYSSKEKSTMIKSQF